MVLSPLELDFIHLQKKNPERNNFSFSFISVLESGNRDSCLEVMVSWAVGEGDWVTSSTKW